MEPDKQRGKWEERDLLETKGRESFQKAAHSAVWGEEDKSLVGCNRQGGSCGWQGSWKAGQAGSSSFHDWT